MTKVLPLLITSLFFLLAGNAALTAPSDTPTALSVQGGKIYLPCQFDSFKTTCLLDSGSGFSTVNSATFDPYPSLGRFTYDAGSGQEIEVDKIRVHEIQVANLRLKNWPVARLPHSPGFLNIIGLDAFLKSSVFFDFKHFNMSVNSKAPEAIADVPFIYDFDVILLPVKIGEQSLLAVWDTGASTAVIDQDYIASHPDDFEYLKDIQGTDAARANIKMKLYKIKSLVIGGVTLKDVRVAAMDLSGMRKHHPDFPVFFLGYNIIIQHNWYFDFPHYQWKFEN